MLSSSCLEKCLGLKRLQETASLFPLPSQILPNIIVSEYHVELVYSESPTSTAALCQACLVRGMLQSQPALCFRNVPSDYRAFDLINAKVVDTCDYFQSGAFSLSKIVNRFELAVYMYLQAN